MIMEIVMQVLTMTCPIWITGGYILLIYLASKLGDKLFGSW